MSPGAVQASPAHDLGQTGALVGRVVASGDGVKSYRLNALREPSCGGHLHRWRRPLAMISGKGADSLILEERGESGGAGTNGEFQA